MRTIILTLLLFSCSLIDEIHFEICPEAKHYVDLFYQKASENGVTLYRDNLVVTLGHTTKYGAIGSTEYGNPNFVILDINFVNTCLHHNHHEDSMWMQSLVFHELGHALLRREHVNKMSIMNPAASVYMNDFINDAVKRELLIKELFQ